MEDADLATPILRKGPSSRLLKRTSLLTYKPNEHSITNETMDTSIKGFTRSPIIRRSVANMSTKLGESLMEVTQPLFSYHIAGRSDPDELILATENLFVDFMASGSVADNDIYERISDFEELLGDQISCIQKGMQKNPKVSQEQHNETQKIKENLTNERNTWRLVGKLFKIRSEFEIKDKADGDMNMDVSDEDEPKSLTEMNVVENLFQNSETIKKAQAVVDWLEMNSKDYIESENEDSGFNGDKILSWESTLHTLVLDKNRNDRLVDQLDPDAKYRLQKPLHEADEDDQQKLLRLIYNYIRGGMLSRAQNLCVSMGEPWRAATLTGWSLCHDPNLGSKDYQNPEKFPMEGNTRRDIWKKTAWSMSNDSRLPNAERAIYSILCGNAKQLIKTKCFSWEDVVWALVKSMVDVLVEREIRSIMNRNYTPLPEEYWDNKTNLEEILQSVKNSEDANVQKGASCPYRILQAFVILGKWDELMKCAKDFASTNDPHLLRFVCHLVLSVEEYQGHLGEFGEVKQILLENYVKFLMGSSRVRQVPWYVAQMSKEADQIRIYASFLATVTHTQDRILSLRLGFENNLPMQAIRQEVVDYIVAFTVSDEDENMDEENEDHRKISGLEWLMMEPLERDYAIIKSNELTRCFIAEHKIEKAKEVLNLVKKILPKEDYPHDHVKESHCLEMYVSAKEAFSDFFDFFHKAEPKKPNEFAVMGESTRNEYTAQIVYEERMKQYYEDMERWHKSLLIQSSDVSSQFISILTLQTGWLLCQVDEESEQGIARLKELLYLRRICTVEVVFLLHSVLHDTKQFKEVTKIADILADEKYGLYSLFGKEEMREILQKLKESSIALIENDPSIDPWGYPKM